MKFVWNNLSFMLQFLHICNIIAWLRLTVPVEDHVNSWRQAFLWMCFSICALNQFSIDNDKCLALCLHPPAATNSSSYPLVFVLFGRGQKTHVGEPTPHCDIPTALCDITTYLVPKLCGSARAIWKMEWLFFHWLENTWQSEFCTSCPPKANMLCLHNGSKYTNKDVNKYNMIQLTADINFSFFISHGKSTFHHVRIVNVSEPESTNSRPSLGTRTAGINAELKCQSCYFLPGSEQPVSVMLIALWALTNNALCSEKAAASSCDRHKNWRKFNVDKSHHRESGHKW